MEEAARQDEVVELTRAEFDKQLAEHGEYSCSLPSGTTIGKKWFRNQDAFSPRAAISDAEEKMADVFPNWWQGEFYELDPPEKDRVGIRWKKIKLKE